MAGARIEPPLTIDQAEIARAVDVIAAVFDAHRSAAPLLGRSARRVVEQLAREGTLSMSWAEQQRDLRFAIGVLRRRPFQVLLQVTNRCNMQCSFCDFWPNGVAPGEELTVGGFRRDSSDELSELGTFLVSIEGGEPLVRPDLVEIVRIFARRHIPLLYTNGWYVDEHEGARAVGRRPRAGGRVDRLRDGRTHDRRRHLPGAFDASVAGRRVPSRHCAARRTQVHVMTVLMRDNAADLAPLLRMSAASGVGHCATLLSTSGFRRAAGAELPSPDEAGAYAVQWYEHPHFRMFGDYFERIPAFLAGAAMPECRAGVQGFNIDHVGNVSHCIEKIDRPFGNVRAGTR